MNICSPNSLQTRLYSSSEENSFSGTSALVLISAQGRGSVRHCSSSTHDSHTTRIPWGYRSLLSARSSCELHIHTYCTLLVLNIKKVITPLLIIHQVISLQMNIHPDLAIKCTHHTQLHLLAITSLYICLLACITSAIFYHKFELILV